jgi:hypothetical protein
MLRITSPTSLMLAVTPHELAHARATLAVNQVTNTSQIGKCISNFRHPQQ